MSHEITSLDRLILAGEPAWHGLGNVVPRDKVPSVREALRMVLPWDVVARPAFFWSPEHVEGGAFLPAPGQAVVRVQAGCQDLPLAVVGQDYPVATNATLMDLAETAEVAGAPDVKVESAGSLRGGRTVFVLLAVGKYGLGLNREDEVSEFLLLGNAHDGTRCLFGFGTSVRVVCANTEAAAWYGAEKRSDGFRIAHRPGMEERIQEAKKALQAGRLQLAAQREENVLLAGTGWTSRTVGEYFARVSSVLYPAVAHERPSDPTEGEAWDRQRERAREVVSSWMAEFCHERQRMVEGTAFAALEAVTHWADHERTRVREVAHDRLFGRGAAIKRAARELVLQASIGVAV